MSSIVYPNSRVGRGKPTRPQIAAATESPEAMQEPFPRLLSIAEAAELTSLSRSFFYDRMNDGSLPSFKLGRARRVREADVRRLIDAAFRTSTDRSAEATSK